MLFNSFQFMIFFPIVIFIYFIIHKKIRYIWLLMSSYYFYMCWNAKYAVLLFFSTFITWISGILMDEVEKKKWELSRIKQTKKWCLGGSIALNLSVLLFFKYFYFITDNINYILEKLNLKLVSPGLDIVLPVGISFYIFQALGYAIDVYRKDIKAERNLFRYALFVSFFPQLVAGPIERSKNLLSQMREIENLELWNVGRIQRGIHQMLWGYFQKLVIADRAAIVVNQVFQSYKEYGFVELFTVTLLFSVQIYCDFGGYSNLAKGAARVMGFDLMDNFRQPYFAENIKDFWRRWHISLTSWFTDYLYIPLGGNRKGKLRQYINTMAVFLCSGIWHGANWTYIVWGGIHGIFQIIGDLRNQLIRKQDEIQIGETGTIGMVKQYISKAARVGFTFGMVSFAWIFFRADTIGQAIGFIGQMFRYRRRHSFTDMGLDTANWIILLLAIFILFLVDYLHERHKQIRELLYTKNIVIRWAVYLCALWFILLFGVYGAGYDASQFIYFQF